MTALPREYDGWKLLGSKEFLSFWSSIGTLNVDGREWPCGHDVTGLGLVLITDEPHPDDPAIHAIYTRDLKGEFDHLANRLMRADQQVESGGRPTSLQYKLGVDIGHSLADALANGASYEEVISTLQHCITLAEFNRDTGRDFTKEGHGDD